MTRLSVNINKIATLRNSRGGNNPDLIKTALDCERFGAEGITVQVHEIGPGVVTTGLLPHLEEAMDRIAGCR